MKSNICFLPLLSFLTLSLAAPSQNAPTLVIKPTSDYPIINLAKTPSASLSKRQNPNSLTCNYPRYDKFS